MWYDWCHTDLCNTEENFCNDCNLNKQMDICSGDYGKPSKSLVLLNKILMIVDDSKENATNEEDSTENSTENSTDNSTDFREKVTNVKVPTEDEDDSKSEVEPGDDSKEKDTNEENSPEDAEDSEIEPEDDSKEKDTKSSEDKEDPNIEPGDDSKEVGGTNDASNQLIPYVWFFVSIISSFPNPINLRWIDVLFNPLRF